MAAGFWDAAPDGEGFLVPVPTEQSVQTPSAVLLNWQSVLKK
jgi:hypothetical protein